MTTKFRVRWGSLFAVLGFSFFLLWVLATLFYGYSL